MRLRLLLILLVCLGLQFKAKAAFVMNPNCIAAYNAIFDLRYTEARKLIQDEKIHNPGNGITVLLEDYLDYLYLQNTNNKGAYDKWGDRKSDRIDSIQDNDKNSPYYLFAQAEVYMHWGMLKAQFGDYSSSIFDLNKAKKLLNENAEKYKDFTPNKKSQAWLELVFGAIPSNLKGIASFFGVKGNVESGYKHLEAAKAELANSKFSFYNDELIYLICQANVDVLHTKTGYERLIAMLNEMNEKSLLKKYMQGFVAFKMGHSADAIGFLSAAPQGGEYLTLPAINYYLGNAKLCRMDNNADDYLLKFIKENQGQMYVKDTYSKLAYFALMNNDEAGYNNYLKLVRAKGAATDEKDKQALKEANDARPDLDLLKARFYFDGGFYTNALTLLKKQDVNDLKLMRDKIELYYRLGRVYDRMNNGADALTNYQKSISIGSTSSYYYAANAALFSGMIYEQKKDYKKATELYNTALQMKNHEYQNSIDTQAKEGLTRIKAD